MGVGVSDESLEKAVAALLGTHTSNEDRNNADSYLTSWQKSPGAINTAIQIIPCTSDQNLAFISLQTIIKQLNSNHESLSEAEFSQMFEFSLNLLRSHDPSDEKFVNAISAIIAAIYAYFPPAFSTCSQFDANQLAKIFTQYLECSPLLKEDGAYMAQVMENKDLIVQVAVDCDISPDFFALLSEIMNVYSPDDLAIMGAFFAKIQQGAQAPECHPQLASMFHTIMEIEPINLEPESVEMYCQMIQLMIELADALLTGPVSELQFALASYIWSEIMDAQIEVIDTAPEFDAAIFQHFNESLPYFVQNLEEFFVLIIPGANNYNNRLASGSYIFLDEIYSFLDTMISFVDSDEIDKELLLVPNFSQAFFDLSDFKGSCSSVDYSIVYHLVQYYIARLQNPTNGAFYAVASSSELLRMSVAAQYAALLPQIGEFDCLMYFIEKCAMFAPDQVGIYTQVILSAFQADPSLDNARILRSLVKAFPHYFIANSNEIVQPLLEWIPEVEAPISASLINGVLSLSMYLGLDENSLGSLLNGMLDVVQESATAIIGEGSAKELALLNQFVFRLMNPSPMEAAPGDKTYTPPPDPVIQFCSNAFERITQVIEPLWTSEDDKVQDGLCTLLNYTLKSNWIQDITIISNWIESILSINPVANHIKLLALIWKHSSAQTPNIIHFLNTIHEMEDPNLIVTTMKLLCSLTVQWPQFNEQINVSTLVSPLSSPYEMIVSSALDLAQAICQITPDADFAMAIMPVISAGLFDFYVPQLYEKTLHLIAKITQKYLQAPNVIVFLLDHVPFRNSDTEQLASLINIVCEVPPDKMTEFIQTMAQSVQKIVIEIRKQGAIAPSE